MSRRSSGLWTCATLLLALIAVPRDARASQFIIISDVDDTVKVSNVLDRDQAVRNARGKLVFAGMPELYTRMLGADSPGRRLRFISAGYLSNAVDDFLVNSHFPAYRLTLHEFSTLKDLRQLSSSIFHFKTDQLKRLYGQSQDRFILVGDDTQSDPNVYAEFTASKKKGQVLAIYIHSIKGGGLPAACMAGRVLPAGCVPFVTAYDIALHEFLAGRLTESEAIAVGEVVFNSDERSFLPGFQHCPNEFTNILSQPPSLAALEAKIHARLRTVCENR